MRRAADHAGVSVMAGSGPAMTEAHQPPRTAAHTYRCPHMSMVGAPGMIPTDSTSDPSGSAGLSRILSTCHASLSPSWPGVSRPPAHWRGYHVRDGPTDWQ